MTSPAKGPERITVIYQGEKVQNICFGSKLPIEGEIEYVRSDLDLAHATDHVAECPECEWQEEHETAEPAPPAVEGVADQPDRELREAALWVIEAWEMTDLQNDEGKSIDALRSALSKSEPKE